MNDIELCQELMTRAEEYQKRKEREFAITELEKIKTEIKALYEVEEINGCIYKRIGVYYVDVIEILDKELSELKGENK